MVSRHSTATITYILTVYPQTRADISPFQGFSYNTLDLTPVLHALVEWPAGLYQLVLDRRRLLFSRLEGLMPLQIEILHVDALSADAVGLFTVLISQPDTVEATQQFAERSKHPLLHVTAATHPRVPHFSVVTRELLYEHCRRVIRQVTEAGGTIITPPLPETPSSWDPESIDLKVYGHNVTVPNELVARSLGLIGVPTECPIKPFTLQKSIHPDEVNAPYRSIILESATKIRELRREIAKRDDLFGAVDLILTAPSVYAEIFSQQLTARAEVLDCDPSVFQLVLDQLLKQKYYPQFLFGPGQTEGVVSSIHARLITSLRKAELDLYTALVGVRAAGYFCPVLRVPPAVNLLRGRLADMATSARAIGHRKRNKLSRLARDIGTELERAVGPETLKFIGATEANVKILSDAPLELLPVEGFPLCLRYATSRITTTPGNLFAAQVLGAQVQLIEPDDLLEILVIRAFDKGDRLKTHLETMVRRYLERSQDTALNIKWVDVCNADEFVEALNSFGGYILVYDGHGSYFPEKGYGTLRIGGEDIDVWALRYRTRVPPIIILSACDTHALDGTHASTANGFLMLGAMTVLGTLAPVNSLHSAAFVGRLMFRLAEYVRVLPGRDILPLRWSEIVGGLIKMNYLTDLLRALRQRMIRLERAEWLEVNQRATDWINALDRGWLEKTLHLVARFSGRTDKEVLDTAREVAYFTETLKYVQLGNPEEIVIIDPNWHPKTEASALTSDNLTKRSTPKRVV